MPKACPGFPTQSLAEKGFHGSELQLRDQVGGGGDFPSGDEIIHT